MPRKKVVKWDTKTEDFVLDKMSEGMQPTEVFRLYADKLPSYKTFARRQVDDLEFKARVDAAYEVIFNLQITELDEITKMTAYEVMAKYGKTRSGDNKEFAEAAEFKKSRIDVLKYSIAKIASIFSSRFNPKQTIEHTGNAAGITFVIADYSSQNLKEKIIDAKIEDE